MLIIFEDPMLSEPIGVDPQLVQAVIPLGDAGDYSQISFASGSVINVREKSTEVIAKVNRELAKMMAGSQDGKAPAC